MKKIIALLRDIARHPYTEIGKSEALKYELAGKWSRCIKSEHKMMNLVHDDTTEIDILSM